MHMIEGQIELFQNSIPNKHLDLDFIMDLNRKNIMSEVAITPDGTMYNEI